MKLSTIRDPGEPRKTLNYPCDVAVDSHNNIYVANTFCHTVYRISINGEWSIIGGSYNQKGHTDGLAQHSRFAYPSGICVDPSQNVFVSDTENAVIRKIAVDGSVTTVAGIGRRFP